MKFSVLIHRNIYIETAHCKITDRECVENGHKAFCLSIKRINKKIVIIIIIGGEKQHKIRQTSRELCTNEICINLSHFFGLFLIFFKYTHMVIFLSPSIHPCYLSIFVFVSLTFSSSSLFFQIDYANFKCERVNV